MDTQNDKKSPTQAEQVPAEAATAAPDAEKTIREIGGFEKKLEPTRFGDWDVAGRCSDF